MKNYLAGLSAVALLSFAPYMLAASTTDLTVKGIITPIACTPGLSNNGRVDYGKISRQDLSADKRTQLRDQVLDLSIQCNGPSRFALVMRDNRDGSAIVNSEIYYGLNRDNSGNNIGLYSLNFDPAQTVVDDLSQVYRTDSTTGSTAWSSSSSRPIPIAAKSYLGFTDVASSNAGPIFIQNLSSRVTIEAVIAPTSELDLSAEIQLDGSATLDMIYF
jgi:type 1 fimbria pilin